MVISHPFWLVLLVWLAQLGLPLAPVLHLTVVQSCSKCVHMLRTSMTYHPQLYHRIHEHHQNWDPKQSSRNLTDGYRFEFVAMKDSEERRIIDAEGWVVLLTREFVSVDSPAILL